MARLVIIATTEALEAAEAALAAYASAAYSDAETIFFYFDSFWLTSTKSSFQSGSKSLNCAFIQMDYGLFGSTEIDWG